jgi:uncharacterized protein
MTQAVRIYEQGETFYVPQFLVKIGGRELPTQVVRDVLQLTYSDSVEEIDSFELSLNNWDAEALAPKYEPPSSAERSGLFDPGGLTDPVKKVEVWMGYLGNLRRMLTGEVTTLEPNFPGTGALTLSVRGLNVLHRFRTEQHTFAWENQTDSQIAEDLGRRPVRKGEPGLGMRVETAPRPEEQAEPYVFMDNQYDVVFLMNRARRHGYELVLKEEDDDEYLFFGPSEERGEPAAPYLLEWGRSLISFRPTLSTARQVSEVIVRGWDRRTNRKIEGKATWEDLVPRGPERDRMKNLAGAFGNRREIVTDRPVHTKSQAETMAKDLLRDRLKDMVQASGATVGLPDLRAGRRVQVVGLGPRFDGEYFVTKSTHTLGDDGYKTEFEARRENAPVGTAGSQGGAA